MCIQFDTIGNRSKISKSPPIPSKLSLTNVKSLEIFLDLEHSSHKET